MQGMTRQWTIARMDLFIALVMGSRIKLLGVLYAGPQHTIHGDIKVVTVPTLQKPVSVAAIPINLGVVIKAEQLNAFEGRLK